MVILTNKPLWQAKSNPKVAGWMALWVIELKKFKVQYRPRTTVKEQVVIDFIVEFTNMEDQGAEEHTQWSIHADKLSNRQVDGASTVLHSPEGDEIKCMVRLDFPTTNNEAKYKALMAGLNLAKAVKATSVDVYCDSQVVTSQMNGDYECKGERMKK